MVMSISLELFKNEKQRKTVRLIDIKQCTSIPEFNSTAVKMSELQNDNHLIAIYRTQQTCSITCKRLFVTNILTDFV